MSLAKRYNRQKLMKMHIMVMDSSRTCRKMVRSMLENAGHSVVEVMDIDVALSMLQNALLAESYGARGFDIILLNYVMRGGVTGAEAANRIRGSGYTGLLFGVSCINDKDTIAHFRSKGVNLVLPKPLRLFHFIVAIQGTDLQSFQ